VPVPPAVAQARSALGVLAHQHADPEKIEEAREALRQANLDAYVQRLLERTPPLTAEEKLRLTRILSS
jgi:hypothetical protein